MLRKKKPSQSPVDKKTRPQREEVDIRLGPELRAELIEMAEKAADVLGVGFVTSLLEAMINAAEPEQKMIKERVLAALLRWQERLKALNVTPVQGLDDFLAALEGKKLSRKHLIILFLKNGCDLKNGEIEDMFGLANVRQIALRTKYKVETLPKKGKSNKEGRSL